jgi:hypothetical protein
MILCIEWKKCFSIPVKRKQQKHFDFCFPQVAADKYTLLFASRSAPEGKYTHKLQINKMNYELRVTVPLHS